MENINQSLAQLEESLKNLDSARKQVELVTNGSNELTKNTSILIKEVNDFALQIGRNTEKIIVDFESKLKEFEIKINQSASLGHETIVSEITEFGVRTAEIKTTVESSINEIQNLSKQTILEQKSEVSKILNSSFVDAEKNITVLTQYLSDKISSFHEIILNTSELTQKNISLEVEKFRKSTIELKTTSENQISDFKLIATKTLSELETEIKKAIDVILQYSKDIQQLVNQISEMELANKLSAIDNNLKILTQAINDVQTSNNQRFDVQNKEIKTNRIISIIGFIVIIFTIISVTFFKSNFLELIN